MRKQKLFSLFWHQSSFSFCEQLHAQRSQDLLPPCSLSVYVQGKCQRFLLYCSCKTLYHLQRLLGSPDECINLLWFPICLGFNGSPWRRVVLLPFCHHIWSLRCCTSTCKDRIIQNNNRKVQTCIKTQKCDFFKLRALKCPEMILAMMKDKPTFYRQTCLIVSCACVCVSVRVCVCARA